MMGPRQRIEPKLFHANIRLNDRLRADHPLRAVAAQIDFGFVRQEVADLYGDVGNPSAAPAVPPKPMFLNFHENVRSERALAERLSERLDWMWFCGCDLDSGLPNHGVPSPGRRRELMRRRKYKMEGSFADAANRHGHKRARWRGLTWVTVRNLLIATAQNIRKLIRRTSKKPAGAAVLGRHATKPPVGGPRSVLPRLEAWIRRSRTFPARKLATGICAE